MRIIDDDDVGLKKKPFDSEMRPKTLGVCGKLQQFCFPLLCWGGIIIFMVWSVGKLKLFCFPFLCWGGIIICIVWSVGKLKLFCFPFLCWGGIIIFIVWSVGKLKLFCFPLLCWGGIIIFIVWSVGKLKLFCFPFLCWGGILIFIMDHSPGHTFYDMQGKWSLLSAVSSTGNPFLCRSIYSAPFGERMLWTQQR